MEGERTSSSNCLTSIRTLCLNRALAGSSALRPLVISWRRRVLFRRPSIRGRDNVRKMARAPGAQLLRAAHRRRGIPVRCPNMAHRRRSSEQSSWFLKIHVEDPPANAAETQDTLRAGDHSFLGRVRHFGRCVPLRTDAFWEERSDAVEARPHYHVEQGGGDQTLFLDGSCA